MKKKPLSKKGVGSGEGYYIKSAGVVLKEPITKTLEKNYMPYAMSVILSRALPQIDGFKPSHRKLLYTMYNMGLLKGKLTKSANIVGATMKLNPHGDAAIYETMVRLSRGYEALLYPFVESKGNFGKFYSRDMAYAASRYTEAKLSPICEELFQDIEKDSVDFVPNYDNTTKEPVLFPIKFPSILINSNVGIAVSMASSICPFNLEEVLKTTIKIIKKEKFNFLNVLKGPDFPGGGFIVRDNEAFKKIYNTGRGSFKIRSRYEVDKENGCIDITQIPYTTTVEAIIDKIILMVKGNKLKEISDVRDETDLNGLKITIDYKRGTNVKNLIAKLFKYTPLEDSYSCNFNILCDGVPKVMGIKEIILNWQKFRQSCVKRRTKFELLKKEKKLHLVQGLNKILLDLDKAIKIIRSTEKDEDVVLNLIKGFEIDEVQAEYVCEIRLRNLNKEYILNKVKEKDILIEQIKSLKEILSSEEKINEIICDELKQIIEKYKKPRKTLFLDSVEEFEDVTSEKNSNSNFNLFITREGYLKKISNLSLRQNSEQKLKEKDEIVISTEVEGDVDILVFSNECKMNKVNLSCFKETKASSFGEFLPAYFKFGEKEKIVKTIYTKNYEGFLLFFYENGYVAKIPLKFYKTNRKKLLNAYYKNSKLVEIFHETKEKDYMLKTNGKKNLVVNSSLIEEKEKKQTKGVKVLKLTGKSYLKNVLKLEKKEAKKYEQISLEDLLWRLKKEFI